MLFSSADRGEEVLAKAERLLDELRPESPLWHRLRAELDELQRQAKREK